MQAVALFVFSSFFASSVCGLVHDCYYTEDFSCTQMAHNLPGLLTGKLYMPGYSRDMQGSNVEGQRYIFQQHRSREQLPSPLGKHQFSLFSARSRVTDRILPAGWKGSEVQWANTRLRSGQDQLSSISCYVSAEWVDWLTAKLIYSFVKTSVQTTSKSSLSAALFL